MPTQMLRTPKPSVSKQPSPAVGEPPGGVPPRAIVMLVAGMCAAWLAAGSTGLWAYPLQNVWAWLALGVALLAGWPARGQPLTDWLILAVGVLLGLVLTAVGDAAATVFGVAVVLAVLAECHEGLTRRTVLLASLAAAVLGVFRLACASIPAVWLLANALGEALGGLAGWLTGKPLSVGSTFAGVDFLVLMAVIYAGWLRSTQSPRLAKSICAAAAILFAQVAYLTALAYCDQLLALLPESVAQMNTDQNRVGTWAWADAVRTLLPWNLPLLAAAMHGLVAVAMFRWAAWLPVPESQPRSQQLQKPRQSQWSGPQGSGPLWYLLRPDVLWLLWPVALAVAIPVLTVWHSGTASLKGKTILAYDQAFADWQPIDFDRPDPPAERMFGMLDQFVSSLGGVLVRRAELTKEELDKADVLLVIHPNRPWPADRIERIKQFVRGGKSLLVAAGSRTIEGDRQSSFDEVLAGTGIEVGYDTAVPTAGNWEHCWQTLAHPATTGIDRRRNPFGLARGSSLHLDWLARPMLTGRFAWSEPGRDASGAAGVAYRTGKRLGDLVLAAERPFGAGRIVVLGDLGPLSDDGNVAAYDFTGRLLGHLASGSGTPQAWWRQLLGLLAAGVLVALLAWKTDVMRLGLSAVVLALSLAGCVAIGHASGRVVPEGNLRVPNNVAYIDASHLEAYSSDPSSPHGTARLARVLMRRGFLPLLAYDLSPDRLRGAGLLLSIAPAKAFSETERRSVASFAEAGGTLICMVGAEEVGPSRELLAQFDLNVPPSPVPPTGETREPEPMGAYFSYYLDQDEYRASMRFNAGWPVECSALPPQAPKEGDAAPFPPMFPQLGVDVGQLEGAVPGGKHLPKPPRVPGSQGYDADVGKYGAEVLKYGVQDRPVIVWRLVGNGSVVLIGDTYIATNDNLSNTTADPMDNVRFWRWLIGRVGRGRYPEWFPGKSTGLTEPGELDAPIEPAGPKEAKR